MQLSDLRNEALAHGADPTQFGASRITQYINDGYLEVCSRSNFYAEEAVQDFSTVAGTISYAFPADFGRIRSLRDTDRNIELSAVGLRDIDRSPVKSGAPIYYAVDGANFHLYPTPDSVTYNLEARYWKIPSPLVNDVDVPILPVRWHKLLWYYAVAEMYWTEEDEQNGGIWDNRFATELAKFQGDAKDVTTDGPMVVSGMWESESSLGPRTGWTP